MKDLNEKITFYLYDYSNKLVKKPKKIYSPYNIKTLWRVPSEDTYINPEYVEFIWWTYILDVEKVWVEKYEQQKEWLSLYTTRWWILSKWKGWSAYKNWLKYRNDWIHVVKTEKSEEIKTNEVKKIIEKVNIQQIPLVIAETMSAPQLRQLAQKWEIELPEDILEKWSAADIKTIIIKLMTENWNISE